MKSYVKFPWLSFTMTIVTPLMGYSTGTFNYLMLTHPNGVFDSIADVKSQIYDVIKEISLIPNNKKTVENTILRWHNFEINLLNDLKEINKALNETTDPVISQNLLSDVYIWLDKAALEGQIYDAIEICMNNILMNSPPNSFEYYIADVYFNSSNYTFKNSNKKIQTEKSTSDCSILTIDSINIKISSQDIICEKISSIDADIICIQQLPLLDTLPIYDTLKHRYTSFAFIQNYTEPSNLQKLSNKGIFLASKGNLEQLPLNNSDIEKDYLKFSISDTSKKIGYFYIYKNTCEQRINNYQFSNILTEVLNINSNQYPVTLCGDFSQFFDSDQNKILLQTHFEYESSCSDRIHALLLKTPHQYTQDSILPSYSITTSSFNLFSNNSSHLTVINKEDYNILEKSLNSMSLNNWDTNSLLLCGGRADLSASKDSDGNVAVEGGISFSGSSDSWGEYSAGANVEVRRDNDGKVSTEGKIEGTFRW